MVDFKKLLNRTPAEKEADRLIIEQKYKAMEEKEIADIIKIKLKVDELVNHVDTFKDKNFKFVHDLQRMSTTYDDLGRMGGRLISLTDKQKIYFDSLYQIVKLPKISVSVKPKLKF